MYKKMITLGGRILLAAYCVMNGMNAVHAQDNTWFVDVAQQVGLGPVMHVGALTGLDVNNDNYPDLITAYGGQNDNDWHLYINEPSPSDSKSRIFVDKTAGSGLNTAGLIRDFSAFADYNNDGNMDMILTVWLMDSSVNNNMCVLNPDNGSRMHIMLGDGQGHFTLKSNSGLEALGPQQSGSLLSLDYNRDGKLDLYVGSHYKNWCYGVVPPSHLLKGNGDGTFVEVSNTAGINYAPLPQFGGTIGDWNDDCNADILTATYTVSGYANLFKNNGDGSFTDVAATANYNPHFMAGDNGQAMVPWAALPADYDNDGDFDLLMLEVHGGTGSTEGRTTIFTNGGATNNYALIPNLNQIVRNNPQNSHHGDHMGFWSDFDNDGWPDLMIGDAGYTITPSSDGQRMFFCLQNSTTHVFTDITKSLGFISGTTAATISDKIRRPSVMIPMDYDNDGDEDIIKTPFNSDDTTNFLVLRNDIGNKNHYLKIKLEAPAGVNKDCIGAKVRIKAGGVWQMRELYGNQGHWTTQYPLVQNFGVGNNTDIDSIDVRWPDAGCSHTVLTHIAADQFITINKTGLLVQNIQESKQQFIVYPNPISNELIIHATGDADKQEIYVRNIEGKVMAHVTLKQTDKVINTLGWPAGTYFVQCYTGEKYNTVKVVKID